MQSQGFLRGMIGWGLWSLLGVGFPLLQTWFMSDAFLESSAAVLHVAWLLAAGAALAGVAHRGHWRSGARGALLVAGGYLVAGFLLTVLLSALPAEGGGPALWRWLLLALEYGALAALIFRAEGSRVSTVSGMTAQGSSGAP